MDPQVFARVSDFGIKSSSSLALLRTKSRQISASASTNQGPKKGVLVRLGQRENAGMIAVHNNWADGLDGNSYHQKVPP